MNRYIDVINKAYYWVIFFVILDYINLIQFIMSNKVDFAQAKPINLDKNAEVKRMQAAALAQKRAERKALRIDCLHLVVSGQFAQNSKEAIKEAKELIEFVTGE